MTQVSSRWRWLRRAVGAGLLLYVVACLTGTWVLTKPWRRASVHSPAWVRGEVTTADGVRLRTYSLPATGRLLVLGHGYHGSARQLVPLGEKLQAEGYAVLSFDFRGHGDSAGEVVSAGPLEARDVQAVLGDVRRQRGTLADVGYVGLSMGAAAGSLAPAAAELAALVLVGCYDSLEHAFENRLRLVGGPLFFLGFPLRWLAEWRTATRLEDARPVDHLPRLAQCDLLLIFGERDRRIGRTTIERMRDAAGPAAQLVRHPGHHFALARLDRDPLLWLPLQDFLHRRFPPR